MRHTDKVWVEIENGLAIRIFNNHKFASKEQVEFPKKIIKEVNRKEAIHQIRKQVFDMYKQECIYCGEYLTFQTMHMHERLPRGKGGEISIYNSVPACYNCHMRQHDRQPKFGE
jgi:5-methylcytosine-specific restriction endonuclease McrA